ncbi:MAG: hypothetical protein GYB58_00745 [Gammaproteobacteria bacterium]|nr:hypothetical protein [Gammaproteobacteria bacterium]
MEVKIFTKTLAYKPRLFTATQEVTDGGLEDEVNLWLKANPDYRVAQIHQTQSGGSWRPAVVTISVWYTSND